MKYFIYMALILTLMLSCNDPTTDTVGIPKLSTGVEVSFPSTVTGEMAESGIVELKNIGNGDLKLEKATFKLVNEEYDISELTDVLPKTIKANETFSFTIRFSPKKVKLSHKNILQFSFLNLEEKLELTLNAPINQPIIRLSPRTLMFSDNSTQSFEIKNVGNAMLTITKDVSIDYDKFSFEDGFSIPEGTKLCPEEASEENTLCKMGNIVLPRVIQGKVLYSGEAGSVEDNGHIVIYNDGETNGNVSYINLTAAYNVCKLYLTNVEENVINFGTVNIRSTDVFSKNIALINIGAKDCTLSAIELEEENAFSIEHLEAYPAITDPVTIPAAGNATDTNPNQYIFKVVFNPTAEESYANKLTIHSSDPAWEGGKKEFSVLGEGSEASIPVAKCDPEYFNVEPGIDLESNPVSVITLNGSESNDPNGSALTYQWEKISAPIGSVALPQSPTSAVSKYFIDLAGEHILRLTVTNEYGVSNSCTVTAIGATTHKLHIELFWDKDGDVDLHFKQPGTTDEDWGHQDKDCYWKTCKTGSGLEWGAPGSDDNPKLDRDDIQFKGPENINLDFPETTNIGQPYMVGVKNYSNEHAPTATVRIYCNAAVKFDDSMRLPTKGKSFWWVAGIHWADDACELDVIDRVGIYPGIPGTK